MTLKWFTSGFKRKRQQIDNFGDSGAREPLDHPELAGMSMRELADLPMPTYTRECSQT
jgi:hypothetical protein